MITEISDMGIKEEHAARFAAMIPTFRQILLSTPGGIEARCMRDQADPNKFTFLMQWESMEAKDVFMADPRMQDWAKEFVTMTTSHVDRYYDDIR